MPVNNNTNLFTNYDKTEAQQMQFQSVLDCSNDLILIVEQTGIISLVNNACNAILGYTPDELTGKHVALLFSDNTNTLENIFGMDKPAEKKQQFTCRHKKNDGSFVTVAWSALYNNNDCSVVFAGQDMTAIEVMEKKVEEEEQKFINLFSIAPTMICILKGEHHRFEMANPTYLQTTGKKNVIGKTVAEVFPEIEDQGFINLLDNVYKTGKPFLANEAHIRLDVKGDGELQDHYLNFVYQTYRNSENEIIGVFVVANFITEQVEARKKSEKKERYFRKLVENSDDIVMLMDKKGELQYISPSFEKITGFSIQELIGKSFSTLLVPEAKNAAETAFLELAEKPGSRVNRKTCILHKNGNPVWIEGVTVNLLDNADVNAIVGNYKDITYTRQTEIKINKTLRLYAFLSQINQCIVHANDEQTVYKECCEIALKFGKFKVAWVGVIDENKNALSIVQQSGIDEEDVSRYFNLSLEESRIQISVIESRGIYVCNDILSDPLFNKWYGFTESRGWSACIVLPIFKADKIVATFNIVSSEINFFDEDEIALLVEAAGDISFAVTSFEKDKISIEIDKNLQHVALRLSQAQRIAHIGSWDINFGTGIAVWSEESCRIYGLPPDDNIQSLEAYLSFIHPEDLEYVQNIVNVAMSECKATGFNHRILRRDGSVRHIFTDFNFEFNELGVPVGVFGIAHDVTESKLAQESLLQSEANLRKIVDLMPQSILVRDIDGKYLFVNQSLADLYDLPKKEILDHFVGDLFPDKEIANYLLEKDKEILRTHKEQIVYEMSFTDRHQKEHLLSVLKTPFAPVNYDKKAVLIIMTDITEQKKAELERSKMINEIILRNKNLEQFSYIVSHNLRSPVVNIIGLSNTLQTDGLNPNEEQSVRNYLNTACSNLDGIIRDLNHILEVNENSGEWKTNINLNELLDDVKTSLENKISKENVVIVSDFSEVTEIFSIKSYLHSIFYNLISNSIKYRRENIAPEVEIRSRKGANTIELSFKDNGMGIDLKKAGDKMFGLYKRFHDHTEGKGIGLYMVKAQVETLGGTINVKSEPDTGTEFTIVFNNADQN